MLLAHHFRFMASYHKHSTVRLIDALQRHLTQKECQQYTHLYFNSIHGTLAHLLGGDQIWYSRIAMAAAEPTAVDVDVDLGSMASMASIYALQPPDIGAAWANRSPNQPQLCQDLVNLCTAWEKLLHDKDDAWVMAPIDYNDSNNTPTQLIRASGLSQVFNHGTHHRGQISAAFSYFDKAELCPSFDLQSMEEYFATYKIKT